MLCRELQAFVFVFRTANRIVVEKPEYGNACYFFDLEQPLPVDAQVTPTFKILNVLSEKIQYSGGHHVP